MQLDRPSVPSGKSEGVEILEMFSGPIRAEQNAERINKLEDAVEASNNPASISLIPANKARQDIRAISIHEQAHADQLKLEPKSNFGPGELFGQQNLLNIETSKTYQKAGEGLMSAGYPYKSLPTEVMAHVVDGRLDDAGKVMTLGVTPEEGLNLYVDLLEAAVLYLDRNVPFLTR